MTYLWTTEWKKREERRERGKTGGRCGEPGSENKIWASGKLMKKVFLILTAVERMFGCDGLDKRQELTLPDSDFGGAGEWRVAGNVNETDSPTFNHIGLFPSSLFLSEQSPPFICYRSLPRREPEGKDERRLTQLGSRILRTLVGDSIRTYRPRSARLTPQN